MPQLWQVAVNAPLQAPFTYSETESLNLSPGTSVKVPFGPKNRLVSGLIIGPGEKNQDFAIKNIEEENPERPKLRPEFLQWLNWVASYYLYPLGQVQEMVFPPLKKESNRKTRKGAVVPQVEPIDPPALTTDQQAALEQISLDTFQTTLLHGVTGSGKTEVYIELIQKIMDQGKKAMVLVPEISLTPQLIKRFAQRFPDEIAVFHSHLTEREKTNQWWSMVSGNKKLIIGARSALFCPVPNLGIIVVDEEHESSFKQEEKLKYNARDAAVARGQFANFPVILGSATPSLETWHNCQVGKYRKVSLPKRVSERPLPQVEIIDLAQHRDKDENFPFWLSPPLYEKLKINFERGLQSALFLNRRGIAPTVQCFSCGFMYMCPNCDITLTLHGSHHLVCHYCNYHEKMSDECPDCNEGEPKAYGLGTEAVEQDLLRIFPEACVFRADRDEINNREALEEMVEKMETGKIDFLVGTQMIAKGLDFKSLTLVGLVQADVALNIPDFRANERSFQLTTQMSGRAGRHEIPGEVIIQTYKPDHESLVCAKNNAYSAFVEKELKHRHMFKYPPFGKIAAIRLSALKQDELINSGKSIVNFGNSLIQEFSSLKGAQILGPTPAPLSRIKNRYRYHILIKCPDHKRLNFIAQKMMEFANTNWKKIRNNLDVDPYSLL